MTNFNDLQTIRSRAGLSLATLAAAIVIAGCGSSSSSSTASSTPTSTPTTSTSTPTTSTSTPSASTPTTSTATTPTSGPLSKEPKVTPPAGPVPSKLVTKEIITGTGREAKTGEKVTVNYVVVLYKGGQVVEGSWKRSSPHALNMPFSFILGNSIIAGWNQGIPGMKVGGRRELIMPASLAWGSHGRAPSIPPNAAVVFVVDLLSTVPFE